MKIKSKNFLITLLLAFMFICSIFAITPLTANAAERDREFTAVESNNALNMRLTEDRTLMWDAVDGATGYEVVLLNQAGYEVNRWDNELTNNRVLSIITEMDNNKYDSGRYVFQVVTKGVDKKASMSYYYTSNVDKFEAPTGLQWVGDQAIWTYVEGATSYKVTLFNFSGVVHTINTSESSLDLSSYAPQDGWTFTVQAQGDGTLKAKRASNPAESPKKGTGEVKIIAQNSGNSLNMSITEDGLLRWDAVDGATGYQVILQNPIGTEIYRWDNDFTNNNRFLPIFTEMNNLKIDSGDYKFVVEPKNAGSKANMQYYYTSHVEKFAEPHDLKWNGTSAAWDLVDGATDYYVVLYDFNGQVTSATVTDDYYDFSSFNPQDGWTFTVQARGDGKLNAKRSSEATESPAKTTSYNLTVVAYGLGNTDGTGKVSMETESGTQDFSTSVGGTFIKNTEVTVKAEANPGYEFVAWRVTTPDISEATLSTDATHTFNLTSNLQLFAVFRAIPTEYTVVYDGNDASGYMADDVVSVGGTYTLKDCGYTKPYGKKFVGWAIGSKNATPIKQPSDEITINADTTIYAVWEELYFTTQPTNTSGKIGKNVILPVEIDLAQVHNDDGYNIVLEVKNGENWEEVGKAKCSVWNSLNGGFTVLQNSACTKEYRYKIYNGTEWIESDTFTVEFLPIIVTFVDNTHSTITEPIEVDTVGDKIKQPDNPTYAGDTFYGWGWPYWDFENQTVTQDTILYAQWAGRGYYRDIPNVYAKLGEKAIIDLSSVNNNGSYVYIYKYDGAEWKQGKAVSGYTSWDLGASDAEKIERYKIVISHSQNIESNEFTVTWTNDLPTYYVSYGVGEGQGSGDADSVEHGTNYILKSYETFGTIIAPNGKVFDYWSIRVGENAMDATEIAQKKAGETITVTSNVYAIAMWKNAPTVTVSYYSIGNIVDSDTIAVGTQHTLMNAQGLDVPSGKKFKAWAIGGLGGEQKQPGDEITITEETYIYAVWEDITYTVSFNANGGTGTMQAIEFAGTYTLPTCTFTAPDGKQFKGWATTANGEVIDGTTYNVTANVELYAIWENIPVVNYTITFNANGGTGDMQAVEYVGAYTLPICAFTAPDGKQFKGWALASDGEVVDGATYNVTADVELYAIWEDIPVVKFDVTFNANGGTGTMQAIEFAGTYTLPTCTFTEPDGKQFKGWSTSANGEVIDATTYNVTANVELFAIWEDIPVVNFKVTFNANGGTGTMSPVEYAGIYTLPTCTFTAPDGKQFKGWATTANGEVIDGTTYNVTTKVELYAIWENIPAHEHNHGTAWESDANNHWNECSCGDKANVGAHEDSDNNGKCDTCDYQMTNVTPDNPEQPKDGLGTGAIIGIVVGGVAVLGLGGFALVWFVIKKKSFADLIAIFKKK